MGGLAGVIDLNHRPDPALADVLGAALAHRGADAAGSVADGPVLFAHRGRQGARAFVREPVVTDDLVVMMDGWLDDPEGVARELGVPQGADVEVLAAAWRAWGAQTPVRVSGPFAAAVWSKRHRTLWLVRDRLGARPMFWTRHGARFAFASELPALFELPFVDRRFNAAHLGEYLSFQTVHAPRTLVRDVFQVEAAHVLSFDGHVVTSERYWAPRFAAPGTRSDPADVLVARLQGAVERAVRRDVPRGTDAALYLSGGLGSTAIAAAARELGRPLPTFTVTFTDDPNPEAPFAGRIARVLGLDHHEVVVGSAELADAFDRAVIALGHPIGNPAVLLELLLASAVAEHAKVAITGHGSDELFGGRAVSPIARDLRIARRVAHLPGVRHLFGRREGRPRWTVPPERFGIENGLGGASLFSTPHRERLLRDHALVDPDVRTTVLAPVYAGVDTDPINTILHAWLRTWLVDERLPRVDRTATRAGLHPRHPLLDHEIVSIAAALPGTAKVPDGKGLHARWPLRAMLAGVVPGALLNRPKRTMPAPLGPWLVGPGRLLLEGRLRRLRTDRLGLWRPEGIDALRAKLTTDPNAALQLWALFFLDAWAEHFRVS
jgi:asparagine synthase (glutamine-hydrolysing)